MSAPPEPVVVDTNVVSYLEKGHPWGEPYKPHLENRVAVVSFQTVAELRAWGRINRWGEVRSTRLGRFLAAFRVAPHTPRLDDRWAEAVASARRAGRRIEAADAWIAATALELGCPLLTHDPRDFAGVEGLEVLTELR